MSISLHIITLNQILICGKVDILINNTILDVTEEEFDKHFSINVKVTYFACQQAMEKMEELLTFLHQ